jgi:hypothetical protein
MTSGCGIASPPTDIGVALEQDVKPLGSTFTGIDIERFPVG